MNLLGLKPFHLNIFKTSIIVLCLGSAGWILFSRECFRRLQRLIEGGRQGRKRIHSAFIVDAETQALESSYRFLLKDESSTDSFTSMSFKKSFYD